MWWNESIEVFFMLTRLGVAMEKGGKFAKNYSVAGFSFFISTGDAHTHGDAIEEQLWAIVGN